jgi:hypothetical protein
MFWWGASGDPALGTRGRSAAKSDLGRGAGHFQPKGPRKRKLNKRFRKAYSRISWKDEQIGGSSDPRHIRNFIQCLHDQTNGLQGELVLLAIERRLNPCVG